MAHHKSALKRIRQSAKRRTRNRHVKAGMRTLIKRYRVAAEAGDEDAPQKLRAAEFLITNMEGHSYQILSICDSAEVTVELDVLAYPDYEALVTYLEEVEKERGELDYKRDDEFKELETISQLKHKNIITTNDFGVMDGRPFINVELIEGDTVREVLSYVQFDAQDLSERLRRSVEKSLREGALTPEESAKLQKRFRAGLEGYTYLVV